MELPLAEVFDALRSVNIAVHRIAGQNAWRQKSDDNKRMAVIDSQLAVEVVAPPSKGVGNKSSVWSKIHFSLLIPAIMQLRKCYGHPLLCEKLLTHDEVLEFFAPLDELKKHVRSQFHICGIGNALKQCASDSLTLNDVITSSTLCEGNTFAKDFLLAFHYHVQHHGDLDSILSTLTVQLNELKTNPKANHPDFGQVFITILDALPKNIAELHPFFKTLIEKGKNENNILGRVFQTYYCDRGNYSYSDLELICCAKEYFTGNMMDLFDRTHNYCFTQLSQCPIQFEKETGDISPKISVDQLLRLYSDWFQRPLVVEMVSEKFKGAASDAAYRICDLIDLIGASTRGQVNVNNVIMNNEPPVRCPIIKRVGKNLLPRANSAPEISKCPFAAAETKPTVLSSTSRIHGLTVSTYELSSNMELAKNMGRLAMFMDVIGNGKGHGNDDFMSGVEHMFGDKLLAVAKSLYTPAQLTSAWGSTLKYTLDPQHHHSSNNSVQQFIDDVASVLYGTSLNIIDHSQDNIFEHEDDTVAKLQALAFECKSCTSLKQLREFMLSDSSATLIRNALECVFSIVERDPLSEKSIGMIAYVARYFEVLKWEPAPISPSEIIKGLSRLEYDAQSHQLLIEYREANNVIKFSIPVDHYENETNVQVESIEYVQERFEQEHLVYPDFYRVTLRIGTESSIVNIPKIGRECYDLMAYDSSRYAGVIIGYGCSVFHATLQFVQLMAIMMGADKSSLSTIQEEFFQIDTALHNRHDLASFQTEQLIQAFFHGRSLTYSEYISTERVYERIFSQDCFAHTRDYLNHLRESSTPTFDEFKKAAFELQQNNSSLYPIKFEDKAKISPRFSFFDGSNVEIQVNESVVDLHPIKHKLDSSILSLINC